MKIKPKYVPGEDVVLHGGARRRVFKISVDSDGIVEYMVWDYERCYDWVFGSQIALVATERKRAGFVIDFQDEKT